MRKIIIDTDPGIDDIYALTFALAHPEIELLGITTVAGNTNVKNGTQNALNLLHKLGVQNINVYEGAEKPLIKEAYFASDVHGSDGIGGVTWETSPHKKAEKNAVDFILESAETYQDELTIVTIGPLTNIALALQKNPQTIKKIKRIISMGGSDRFGNVTTVAEFNYWFDPDAAAEVFESGIEITMVGLNLTHQLVIDMNDYFFLKRLNNRYSNVLTSIFEHYANSYWNYSSISGAVPHDLLAVALVVDPEISTYYSAGVRVDTDGLARGMSIVDTFQRFGERDNCQVGQYLNKERFYDIFFGAIAPEHDVLYQRYKSRKFATETR